MTAASLMVIRYVDKVCYVYVCIYYFGSILRCVCLCMGRRDVHVHSSKPALRQLFECVLCARVTEDKY